MTKKVEASRRSSPGDLSAKLEAVTWRVHLNSPHSGATASRRLKPHSERAVIFLPNQEMRPAHDAKKTLLLTAEVLVKLFIRGVELVEIAEHDPLRLHIPRA